jgi:hypothetical protein
MARVAAHGLLVALRAGAEKERGAIEADRDVRALERVRENRVFVAKQRLEVNGLGLYTKSAAGEK